MLKYERFLQQDREDEWPTKIAARSVGITDKEAEEIDLNRDKRVWVLHGSLQVRLFLVFLTMHARHCTLVYMRFLLLFHKGVKEL